LWSRSRIPKSLGRASHSGVLRLRFLRRTLLKRVGEALARTVPGLRNRGSGERARLGRESRSRFAEHRTFRLTSQRGDGISTSARPNKALLLARFAGRPELFGLHLTTPDEQVGRAAESQAVRTLQSSRRSPTPMLLRLRATERGWGRRAAERHAGAETSRRWRASSPSGESRPPLTDGPSFRLWRERAGRNPRSEHPNKRLLLSGSGGCGPEHSPCSSRSGSACCSGSRNASR